MAGLHGGQGNAPAEVGKALLEFEGRTRETRARPALNGGNPNERRAGGIYYKRRPDGRLARYDKRSPSGCSCDYKPRAKSIACLLVETLRGLASEKLRPSEVFDVDSIGRFLAVADLWGAWHVLRWHNIRFYVNPLGNRKQLLEIQSLPVINNVEYE